MDIKPLIQIIGRKNSGKTTLIEGLVTEFVRLGYSVGTIKHTSHDHEFDKPGSDSFKHTEAGSSTTVILSPGRLVCHTERPADEKLDQLLKSAFEGKDVILCEGCYRHESPAIESVAPGSTPLFADNANLIAFAADEDIPTELPAFPRSDACRIASWLIEQLGIRKR